MNDLAEREEVERGYVLLSSNFTIFPLFSRGCLFPPKYELGDEYEFPEPHASVFVPFRSSIPVGMVEKYISTARNVVPIAIVVKNGVSRYGEGICDVVLLSDVEKLVFRSEKEIRHFEMSSFADVDLSSLEVEMTADETVFAGESKAVDDSDNVVNDLFAADSADSKAVIRSADAFGGLCCGLMRAAPGKRNWFVFIASLLSFEDVAPSAPVIGEMKGIADACIGRTKDADADIDSIMLSSAVEVLLELKPTEGWPAKRILSSIGENAKTRLQAKGLHEGMDRLVGWSKRTSRVLDDEDVLPSLSDDGYYSLRALILLLVRKNTESLIRLLENRGEERVGQNVWLFAFALAALHEGLRALPKEFKYDGSPEVARKRIEMLGECVYRCKRELEDRHAILMDRQFEVVEFEESAKPMLGLSIDGTDPVLKRPLEENPALTKAASDCRYYGFEVGKVGAEHFDVSSGADQKLKTNVQVSVWLDPSSGKEVLRFKSVAKAFAASKGRRSLDPSKSVGNRLTKSQLLTMLLSNSEVSQNCRVAIELDPLSVVAVVDQMLDTMDRDECIAHLRNVSDRASDLSDQLD